MDFGAKPLGCESLPEVESFRHQTQLMAGLGDPDGTLPRASAGEAREVCRCYVQTKLSGENPVPAYRDMEQQPQRGDRLIARGVSPLGGMIGAAESQRDESARELTFAPLGLDRSATLASY